MKLRKSNNIDLKNSIIIFDEAHNVVSFVYSISIVEYKLIRALKERICEDSASAEINSTGNFVNIAFENSKF
jgi:hypothetical protein